MGRILGMIITFRREEDERYLNCFKTQKKPFDYFYCKKLSVEGETAVSQISAVKIFGL